MMPAFRLGRASLSANRSSSIAIGAVIVLGTVLLTGLGTLLQTGLDRDDQEVLVMLPAILGSWAFGIVVFGVASVVSVSVAARAPDLALLRAVAASPRQIRFMVLTETLMITIPAIAIGLVPGLAFGALLFDELIAADLVDASVTMSFGWLGIAIGSGTAMSAAVVAAWIAGAGPSRVSPGRAVAATVDGAPHRRRRSAAGLLLVLLGLSLSVTTAMMPNGPVLSSTAGPAAVVTAIGLCVVAPTFLAPLNRLGAGGPALRLAMYNVRFRRTNGALTTPVIMLVGIATSTLAMQRIDDSAAIVGDSGAIQLAPINYVVVAMLIGFTAILVVTGVITSLHRRRREFGLLRIAVATRSQVVRMVAVETTVVTAVAVLLGCLAAGTAVVPFALVRTGSPMSVEAVWVYPLVAVGAAAIVALSTSAALRSTLSSRSVGLALAS